MPLTPEERREFTRLFVFVWVQSWGRYRALLSVLQAHGLGPAERLEDEADEWMRAHSHELDLEAVAKLDEFLARIQRERESPP